MNASLNEHQSESHSHMMFFAFSRAGDNYRGGNNNGVFVLLSRTQAGTGRAVKEEQEEITRNHVHTFIPPLYTSYLQGESRFMPIVLPPLSSATMD